MAATTVKDDIQPIRRMEWRPTPAPRLNVDLTNRDVTVLWLLARNLYATSSQVMAAGFPSMQMAHKRLSRLEAAGLVGGAVSLWHPRRRMMIWGLTDAGAQILKEYDRDQWTTYYDSWRSPVGQSIAQKRSLLHELGRNAWCHRMERLFLDTGWTAEWLPGSAGYVRAYPNGGTMRVELTPDAVFFVNNNYWMVEYERSWRTSTLQAKLRRYGLYYKYRLWESQFQFRTEPRVVFVFSPTSTQEQSLITWIQQFTDDLGTRGWLVRDSTDIDAEYVVPAIHWSGMDRKMVRDSWFYTNEHAPRG